MSSTIFYKFFHQKEQSTLHFDGTGINVFDLKHEIIEQNLLGDGHNFMLRLYHLEQPTIEYENDQDVIPRSTLVFVKRSPCSVQHGKFQSAARYVSGVPRINHYRPTQPVSKPVLDTTTAPVDESLSEEDKIKLMLERQDNAWAKTQEELSTHRIVFNKPTEDLPPPGYVCYRCGGKDHWIKNCPSITDPTYEARRIKRTTGIPKSYMKTISREQVEQQLANPNSEGNGIKTNENGDLVDAQGNTYMITEDGDYVMTFADSKTWALYQEKQESAAKRAKLEFEDGLVKRIIEEKKEHFLDPLSTRKRILRLPIVMTPCCQTMKSLKRLTNINYCQADLELVLIENDFHCPNCGAEDILLDSLIRNEELEKEISEYLNNINQEEEQNGKRKLSEVMDDFDSLRPSKKADVSNTITA